jgi:hypothetical protein
MAMSAEARRNILAAIGNVLEWYDFAIYGSDDGGGAGGCALYGDSRSATT